MIAVLISFQAIEIAYADNVDESQHVMLSQPTDNTFAVVKEGVKIKSFFEHILNVDQSKMEEQESNGLSIKPIFVCFSPKNKKNTKDIFKCLSEKLQNRLIYFNIDKAKFGQYSFNRPLLVDNEISFGQGFSQLRAKQQLRIALNSHLQCNNIEFIFIQKNSNEIKELKKEGFSMILDQFDTIKYDEFYKKAKINLEKSQQTANYAQPILQHVHKHPFAKKYLERLFVIHKQVNVKSIVPFQMKNLTIQAMIKQLFVPSIYYNISPKSWVNNPLSQEIVSYVFHNLSDQQLYLAKTSRPKDLTNQQDFQIKVLTYYLTFLINPEAFCVPHDKHSTLSKFSKIKAYQNKKAFLNVRPYIQELQTLSQLNLKHLQYFQLFSKGTLFGQKVKGVGGTLLFSWLINQNLKNKTLSQQTALISHSNMSNLAFINRSSLYKNADLVLCRTDYFSPFNMSTYKVINDFFILNRQKEEIVLKISQISQELLQEMCDLLSNVHQQILFMIKNLFIYYRWNTKMIFYYELFKYRFNAISQLLRPFNQSISVKSSLLLDFPRLACLLIPQNYDFFLLPPKGDYFPYQSNFQQKYGKQKQILNPYLSYMNKGCSFAIIKIDFPYLSFLQWIKSTSKYQIIEYMSMINKTLQEYIIMDKRLKLVSVNDKKNVVLVIDHAQLFPDIINRPKGVKTVLIYRLKKPEENEDVATVGSEVQRKDFFYQSEDQLIKVLVYWGSRVIQNVTKLQLYDWVLLSYISIKCGLFSLQFSSSKQFLITLHKAISTNKHRLKQLEQNHKKNCNYLYTYPIFKQNQKIQLNYHLFQFLHVKLLFNQILQNRWNCKLQTYQNASVNILRRIMELQIIQRIVRQLIVFLRQISDKKLDALQYSSLTGDCLQLARSLTQINKNQDFAEEVMVLHYELFVEVVKIKNYNSIEHSCFTGNFVCLASQESFQIMNSQKSKVISMPKSQVIALSGYQDRILMLNFNKGNQKFTIQEFIAKQAFQIELTCSFSMALENLQILCLLREKKYKKLHFYRLIQRFVLTFIFDTSTFVAILNPQQQQAIIMHQYSFSQNLVQTFYIQNANFPYIICTTIEDVLIINLEKDNLPKLATHLFSVNFGITKIFVKQMAEILHIFLYKLHVIEHYMLKSNRIESKTRFQLKRNIKNLAFEESTLYLFYENYDSMDILRVKEGGIEKVWTYYWVQPSVHKIFPIGDSIFLQSSNYIKHIRLRNAWKKEQTSKE